jgi:hypothetical protein
MGMAEPIPMRVFEGHTLNFLDKCFKLAIIAMVKD